MAFEVADFDTFFAILGQHPEWQVRLRKMLMDDELAESRRAMNEGFARLTATIEGFASETRPRLDRLEGDVGTLKGNVATLTEDVSTLKADMVTVKADVSTLKADVSTLKADVSTLKADVHSLKSDVATLKGSDRERWYANMASAIFGRVLRSVRASRAAEMEAVNEAFDHGVLSGEDWDDVTAIDLVVSGRSRADGADLHVAVEISWTLDEDDIERAIRRAGILTKAGLRCIPAIAGPTVPPQLAALAETRGVSVIREGLIYSWAGESAA